jgi:hypothetical protein
MTDRSPKVLLKTDAWFEQCERANLLTDLQRAKALGVTRKSINEVQNGHTLPGNKFIAGAMLAFGAHCFPVIFDAVDA